MTDEQLLRADMELLLERAEFGRFLLRVIQMAGIFRRTANGSDGRNFDEEGRRNLGLEILEMAEAHQPRGQVTSGMPQATLLQILLEEARKPEDQNAKRQNRYDRTAELDEPDEP